VKVTVGLVPLPIYIKEEATLACFRLKVNFHWVQTHGGHTGIRDFLPSYAPIAQTRGDRITAENIFDKNYTVEIFHRDDWSNQALDFSDDVICFTDGLSSAFGQSGTSDFNRTTNQEYVVHTTIW